MIEFIKKIISFSLLLLIINTGFYFIVKNIYYNPYKNDINKNCRSYLLADSHGLPINNLIEDVGIYNFSAGGDSYFDINRKLNYLIRNKLVDTIYLTVDNHTLNYYREKMNNIDRSIIYIDKSDYNSFYEMTIDKLIKRYIVLLNPKARSVLLRYFSSNLLKSKKSNIIKEWETRSLGHKKKSADNRFRLQFNDSELSKKLTQSFLNIIEVCKNNNITLIGIRFPLTKVYNDKINNKPSESLRILVDKGYKVLDFKELYLEEDSYFKNEDHLNYKGGLKFSNHFKEIIKLKYK